MQSYFLSLRHYHFANQCLHGILQPCRPITLVAVWVGTVWEGASQVAARSKVLATQQVTAWAAAHRLALHCTDGEDLTQYYKSGLMLAWALFWCANVCGVWKSHPAALQIELASDEN